MKPSAQDQEAVLKGAYGLPLGDKIGSVAENQKPSHGDDEGRGPKVGDEVPESDPAAQAIKRLDKMQAGDAKTKGLVNCFLERGIAPATDGKPYVIASLTLSDETATQ